MADEPPREESLDPQDWNELKELGHRMVEDMVDYLASVRDRPAWEPVSDQARDALRQPVPREPQGAQRAYLDFREHVLPFPMGNIHPRFWGWVIGTGTASGALAEMLAATLNPNVGGGNHVANDVEAQVIAWCKALMGFPAAASGLLTSGGSMANLVGLTVARNAHLGFDVREHGLQASSNRWTLYGSTQMHSSIQKAVELLGLGHSSLREIPVDDDYQIDTDRLEQTLSGDREAGYRPFCLVGNAGTVNTGAFDDLNALADIAEREDLWFHVDGAFGAWARLTSQLHHRVQGMERADSLAFDLHKWMYVNYEAGCTLVRDEEAHRRSFSLTPDYLEHAERGLGSGDLWFSDYGVQLSRGFRGLKIWMSFKEHGLDKYARLIQQNVDQARYLAELVQQTPSLELKAPVPLNIVCFRYAPEGIDPDVLDRLNREILMELHEQGIAVPSYTMLGGAYVIRVAITNHRSRRGDFDLLVREVVRLGDELRDG